MRKKIKIRFYGATGEVGRSCFVFEKEKTIGVEAGIKLGKNIEFPTIEEKPEILLISHSHLDHVGFIPHLKHNYNIIATKPTRELMPVILSDYARISGFEFNANDIIKRTKIKEFGEKFRVNGFGIELFNAGHILGSAMIKVEDVLYTADFNARGSRILESAKPVKCSTLIIESTYGGREDIIPPLKEELAKLCNIIEETVKRGGIVLIPSFAIGRAQEILIALEAFMRSKRIPKVPIYIDGMIKKAMRIYRMNVIYAKKDLQNQILMSLHDPFLSDFFKVSRHIDRKDVKKPSIIVTTSGMLTGGPVYKYLKLFGEDENSTLVFVGYQAEGTPGRDILEGKRVIRIDEEEKEIKMRIERIKISGHSDRNDLIRFINTIKPSKVILVHGEKDKMKELEEDLISKYDVIAPKLGEEIEV